MMRYLAFATVLFLFPSGAGAQEYCPKGNLLAKKRPHVKVKLKHSDRVTDNVMPGEGEVWNGKHSAILSGKTASVTYKFAKPTRVRALLFQGDNNDTYTVSTSMDGKDFTPLWTVPSHPRAGMRMRLAQNLDAPARFLRLDKPKGDGSYSVGEFQAFCKQPKLWPPSVDIKAAGAPKKDKDARKKRMGIYKMWVGGAFAFLIVGLMLLPKFGPLPWLQQLVCLSTLGILGVTLFATIKEQSSLSNWSVKLAMLAMGLAVLWVAWMVVMFVRHATAAKVRKYLERGALISMVFVGGFSWINFGTFHGHRSIHYWDSFHYYVGSKYFPENGYSLIYHCTAIGELDDDGPDNFDDRKIRNLADNKLYPATKVTKNPEICREAFSDPRWAAFRQDLRLFRSYMGKSWWQKMFKDHGFNATPVWTMLGHPITNYGWDEDIPKDADIKSPLNLKKKSAKEKKAIKAQFQKDRKEFEARISRLTLVDFGLYIGIFMMIFWAFGLRGCAFSIMIFGLGYPWAYFWTGGSFGRVPWLFMAVAGMCFMKKGHSFLGGFGITWAMLLRVFPGALIAGVSLKIARDIIVRRALPNRSHLMLIAGCTAALVILVPASTTVVGGFDTYSAFLENSFKHKGTALTNHMGLPTLMAYRPGDVARKQRNNKLKDPFSPWKKKRIENFEELKWLYWLIMIGFAGFLVYASRRLEDWELTALSTFFILGIFELTCYYYSFMVLLAPLALRRIPYMLALLFMNIVGQCIQLYVGWYDEQYIVQTALVFSAMMIIAVGIGWEVYREDEAEKANGKLPSPGPADHEADAMPSADDLASRPELNTETASPEPSAEEARADDDPESDGDSLLGPGTPKPEPA